MFLREERERRGKGEEDFAFSWGWAGRASRVRFEGGGILTRAWEMEFEEERVVSRRRRWVVEACRELESNLKWERWWMLMG